MLVGPESCTSLWPPSVVSVNLCRWQCAHAKLFPIFSKHLHIHILQRKKYLQSLSLLFPARYREKKSILDFLGICLGRGFFEPFALAGNFADALPLPVAVPVAVPGGEPDEVFVFFCFFLGKTPSWKMLVPPSQKLV